MRLLFYADYSYHADSGRVSAETSFALFVAGLSERLERLILIGRMGPSPDLTPYDCGERAELIGLPYYESLANPLSVARVAGRSALRFWRALGEVDAVWLLGPHPLAIVFALLAALRGRRVILGVRQDLPAYVRNRHPGRRLMIAAASASRQRFASWPGARA